MIPADVRHSARQRNRAGWAYGTVALCVSLATLFGCRQREGETVQRVILTKTPYVATPSPGPRTPAATATSAVAQATLPARTPIPPSPLDRIAGVHRMTASGIRCVAGLPAADEIRVYADAGSRAWGLTDAKVEVTVDRFSTQPTAMQRSGTNCYYATKFPVPLTLPALARFTLTTRSDAPETWVGQFPEIQAMPDDCTTASVADVKRPLTRKRLGRALAELQAAADKGDTVSMVTLTRHVRDRSVREGHPCPTAQQPESEPTLLASPNLEDREGPKSN